MSRDVVVVGAGHNGLVTATLLAKRGRKVTVVESRDVAGGIAAGEEFAEGYRSPGLLHDTTGLRPYVVDALGLKKHGLKLQAERPSVLLAGREGEGIVLDHAAKKCHASIAKHSKKDADRYADYRGFLDRIGPILNRLVDEIPPDTEEPQLAQIMNLLRTAIGMRMLGAEEMMALLRVFPMCVADFTGEYFENDLLKAGLCGPAIYGTWMGPWSPMSATNLVMWEISGGTSVVGGPQALTAALLAAAKDAGVTIRTGSPVERIRIEDGKVAGVTLAGDESLDAGLVAASCDPRRTLLDLVEPRHIDPTLDFRLHAFRVRGTTAKVNLALDGPLEFTAMPAGHAGKVAYVRTGEHVDELEKAFDAVKYREFSDTPVLEVYLPTVEDPSLAPDGHHVASVLVHFASHTRDSEWDDATRDRLGKVTLDTLAQFAPGVKERVVAKEVLTPVDLEGRYGLTGGHVHHGEHAIDQWILRPTPECSRYSTPIDGLYLCGSGSHPGGGITGAPGYLAAKAIP